MNQHLADLLPYEEARDILLAKALKAKRVPGVELPLRSCLGRVLMRDVQSPVAVPYFDNVQMDGYAVCAQLTQGASPQQPLMLPVRGAWAAGDRALSCSEECAYEVTTGAMMPASPFDAVIKVEDVELHTTGDGLHIVIRQELRSGENVRYRGADFAQGQLLAQAGRVVSPEMIMACAGLGIDHLAVYEPLRIAVLATGKELQRYSDLDLREGAIRDASGPYLDAVFQNPIYELIVHKLIPDEAEMFQRELELCLELQPDLIISTGAVSMGRHDFVPEVLKEAGGRIVFHKVAVRPGKPILFAEWEAGPVLFGLPGNPISTLIGWRFFAEPYTRALLDRHRETAQWALLDGAYAKPESMTCFYKAKVSYRGQESHIHILEGQGSHLMSPLLEANAWAVLPEGASHLKEGMPIAWYPLQGSSAGEMMRDGRENLHA